jgi:hypothetical protein
MSSVSEDTTDSFQTSSCLQKNLSFKGLNSGKMAGLTGNNNRQKKDSDSTKKSPFTLETGQ